MVFTVLSSLKRKYIYIYFRKLLKEQNLKIKVNPLFCNKFETFKLEHNIILFFSARCDYKFT